MRIFDDHVILSVAVSLLALSCGPRERAEESGQTGGAPTDTALRAKPGTQTGPPAGEQPQQPVKPEPGTRGDTAGYRGMERAVDTGQAAGADTTADVPR